MREFLNNYGLLAAFLIALVENDVAFIAIGVVARLGDGDPSTPDNFNAVTALAAAVVGALFHDTFWYSIGRQHSEWFKSSKVYQRIGPTIERLANRFGPWEIFFSRFVYGTRNPTSVFWGIHHLPYATFAGIEILALSLWGGLLVTIGINFTGLALKIIGRVERHHHPHVLFIAIAAASVVVLLLRWLNRRRIYKRQLARLAIADKTSESGASPGASAPEDAARR